MTSHPLPSNPSVSLLHSGSVRLIQGEALIEIPEKADPVLDVRIAVDLIGPDGAMRSLPAYWAGENRWQFRDAPELPGHYQYKFRTAGETFPIPPDACGEFEWEGLHADSALQQRGALRVSPTGKHFATGNGDPFLWLADSWWHGMTTRIQFPDEFRELCRDRAAKGFSVIQFACAFACDIEPFDPRDFNESNGTAWTEGYGQLRPEYFEGVDQRILCMLEEGLMPNLVGAWGYYIRSMGVQKMKAHWRYLIARYGALPLVWTLCGEVRLAGYTVQNPEVGIRQEVTGIPYLDLVKKQVADWTEVAKEIRAYDPWNRLLTVHVGPKPQGEDIPELEDLDLLDFHMLQPGHDDQDALRSTKKDYLKTRERVGEDKIIMVGECCFEGMHGGAGPKIQRNLFWSTTLAGHPGYCYGADAIWQFNREDELFGPSANGQTWGNNPWQEAMHWGGSLGIGIGAQHLRTLPWWRLQPHPEWVENLNEEEAVKKGPYVAGIPGELVLIYFPQKYALWSPKVRLQELPVDTLVTLTYLNPINGDRVPMPDQKVDADGKLELPSAPVLHDWALLLTF